MTKIDNYEEAYAEVIEVLNYIPMNEYKKIPKKYIVFMEENCSENSSFTYNIALPFEKQNISDTAKNILGMIFRLFVIEQSKKKKSRKPKEVFCFINDRLLYRFFIRFISQSRAYKIHLNE